MKPETPAANLSHGQTQWLELGMLIVQDPKLLLLDEPTAGMTQAETPQDRRDHQRLYGPAHHPGGRARHGVRARNRASKSPSCISAACSPKATSPRSKAMRPMRRAYLGIHGISVKAA